MSWKKKAEEMQEEYRKACKDSCIRAKFYSNFIGSDILCEIQKTLVGRCFEYRDYVAGDRSPQRITEIYKTIFKVVERFTGRCLVPVHSHEVVVKYVYIIGYSDGTYRHYPVFLIDGIGNVDHLGRVYNSWDCLEKNNMFPKGTLCYPMNGIYGSPLVFKSWEGNCVQDFRKASGILSTTLVIGSIFAGPLVAAGALGVAAFCEITASIAAMSDRVEHKQSISLKDPEGRKMWASLGGGVCTAVTGVAGVAAKSSIVASSRLGGPIQKGANAIMKVSKITNKAELCLGVVMVTVEICEEIFKHIKKFFIYLKGKAFAITIEFKEFAVKLWFKYFPNLADCHLRTANGISKLIDTAERMAEQIQENTMEGFQSILEFLTELESSVMKNYEDCYKDWKSRKGDSFTMTEYHRMFGIIDYLDEGMSFLGIAIRMMEKIKQKIAQVYEEIVRLNQSEGLKFENVLRAMTVFVFNNCTVGHQLSAEEFFHVVRKVAGEKAKCVEETRSPEGIRRRYYDKEPGAIVTVLVTEGHTYLDSCEFVDWT